MRLPPVSQRCRYVLYGKKGESGVSDGEESHVQFIHTLSTGTVGQDVEFPWEVLPVHTQLVLRKKQIDAFKEQSTGAST